MDRVPVLESTAPGVFLVFWIMEIKSRLIEICFVRWRGDGFMGLWIG